MSIDLIHVLAFDFTGQPGDSVELADWVKADLLPVIEDVLDERRAPGHKRIERLVLDLGTVTAEEAGSELPRRLREQLAPALAAALAEAGIEAPGKGGDLLAFLRTGAMPWRAGPTDHAAHTVLLREVLAAQDASAVLNAVLHEPHMLTRLIRQFDSEALCAAAGVLFSAWPSAQRAGALVWAAGEARRLPRDGPAMEQFWHWLLAQRAHPGDAGALSLRWQQRTGGSFSPEAMRSIERGLATGDVALLAPYWGRILASAPQCLRAAHPHLVARWLRDADDAMLADLLGVVQADCAWLLTRLGAGVPRARLAALLRPAMAKWLALPVDTLAPHEVLAWVRSAQPDSSSQCVLSGAADGPARAVDSTSFRAPLRVLGSLFARAEIITISKALNAGAFAQLAPYWDRLLVLAPHWLRSEYPRLARTWAIGFHTEVLIDILSVVQAECCAPIEQLAATLPREQLHAALRPFLPDWFEAGVDALLPQTILDAAQCANPAWLEEVLLHADMAQLEHMWPAVVMAQRVSFRRIWAQLPTRSRERAIARLLADLPVVRQADVAVILQPAVARMVAERTASGASLDRALPFLLRADVASVVPDQLLDCLRQERVPEPIVEDAPATLDAVVAAAQVSEAALRLFVAACQHEDPQLGQLNSVQLHALVRAWARFRQAEDFLGAIEAGALLAAAPHVYFAQVLQQALAGEAIDLDAIGALCARDAAFAAAQGSAPALRAYVAACQHDDAQFGQFSADQLHALVRSWTGFQDTGASLAAIEAAAHMATAPHAFFRNILEQAMRGVPIDVDPIDAPAPGADADTAATGSDSPVPSMLLRALPRRLADALLRADLTSVEIVWPEIVRYHPDLLAQAAQRYLGRTDARERLLGAVDAPKVHDLLGCVSAPGARLVAPLVDGAGRFAILLPVPLSPDAFQQRILRFAFAQAMERTAPAGWVAGLLRAVMPGQSEASRLPVAHAWHELLRGSGTPLESALDNVLHGRALLEVARRRVGTASTLPEPLQYMLTAALCHRHPALTDELLAHGQLAGADPAAFSVAEWQDLARAQLPRQPRAAQQAFWRAFASHQAADERTVQAAFAAAFGVLARPAADAATVDAAPAAAALPEGGADTLAILLMRASAPDVATSAAITLLAQRLLSDAAGHAALRSALADVQAVERLTAILPGPTLARLLCALQPALAGALPTVLRAVAATLSMPLSAVPATLDNATWRTIYAAVFTGPVPTGARALAARLTGTAPSLDEPPAPGDPMAQLLQPLAAAPPASATARSTDDPARFTGDANLRNAGLVLIAPYIERLFNLLDITRDGDFISDETRQRGVHLLQYAVTAEEATPEYLLALNKLLCGIPAAVPVAPGITMSDREKETIEQLLGSVVAHWSALGSSTVAALRETFLQRDGALCLENEAWRLKIPQRTFDMLLDRLPWSFKLIKFSWMAAPLNVTWR